MTCADQCRTTPQITADSGRRGDISAMISAKYCATMARYNQWQNSSLVAASAGLDDAGRLQDRGAFFGSIQRTFSHSLWGDTIWMAKFDGGDPPAGSIQDSPTYIQRWDDFVTARAAMDTRILAWADELTDADLDGDLTWWSGALGRETSRELAVCVAHFFNHQTHHRGQIHAMLTAAGQSPDDTDLFMMQGLET